MKSSTLETGVSVHYSYTLTAEAFECGAPASRS
jgi:hypothetical protein